MGNRNDDNVDVHLGFTGSSRGMTAAQKERCSKVVKRLIPTRAIHGDCVGADGEFHDMVRLLAPRCWIEIYPSTHTDARANKAGDKIHEPRPPLDRNPLIVAASRVLLATPETAHEIVRSGTWTTIRCARREHLPIYIVTPNGEVEFEQE